MHITMRIRGHSFRFGYIILTTGLVLLCAQAIFSHPHQRRHHHGSSSIDSTTVNSETARKVYEHRQMVNQLGSCDPKPRVFPVHKFYPDPSKFYTPHCTVLYRCGGDGGCCGSDNKVCVVKSEERVSLYFFSWKIGRYGEPETQKVEILSFMNHTQCECVSVNSISDTELTTLD